MIIVSNHDVVQQHPSQPTCPMPPLESDAPKLLPLYVADAVAHTDNVVDDSSSKTVICHCHSQSEFQLVPRFAIAIIISCVDAPQQPLACRPTGYMCAGSHCAQTVCLEF